MLAREAKVGAFVLAGLTVLGLVIFLIGEERRAFGKKETYVTVFEDVQGLRRGSPVRMGGVDIGAVSDVAYGEDAKDDQIYVKLSIVAEEARRIREDSVATIAAKGLLGDKMVIISVGSIEKRGLAPGARIQSDGTDNIEAMITRLGSISGKVERIVTNLERTSESFSNEQLHEDLQAGVGSLSRILGTLERKEGYVGKLLGDPAEAERVSRTLANLERATTELQHTANGMNQILARVQHGPGLAHEVIYGEEGAKVAGQVGLAAEELGLTLRGIREGDGLAHGMLFGGDDATDELVANLNATSDDVREIVQGLKAGRGTLGALLVDPSVYEDLKLLLGNVERNKALRALVRYSIRREDTAPQVADPDAPSRAARPAPGTATPELGGALGTAKASP